MNLVIKLSGESLGGDGNKYSEDVLENISSQIKSLLAEGHKVSLVVGGGNLFRGVDLAGKLAIDEATGHYIGMLATVQNALVLRDYFESKDISSRVSSAISMPQVCEAYIPKRAERHLDKGRVVIFGAGLGAPFFTTDTTAVHRALEMKADMLIMAKNGIDKLYSADPKTDKSATPIDRVSAADVLGKNLKVADQAAIALAKENGLTIKVIGTHLIKDALDDNVGSIIDPA